MHHDSSSTPDTLADGPETKPWACVSCAQKKIKCDRLIPACSHCVAKDRDCEYKAPPPPNRKKRKTDQSLDQRMLGRIIEYEQILQRMHVPFESFLESERRIITDADFPAVRRSLDAATPASTKDDGEEAGKLWHSADGAREWYYSHGLIVSLTEQFKDGLLLEPEGSSETTAQDDDPETAQSRAHASTSIASRLASPSSMPLQAQWIPDTMLMTFISKLWPVFTEAVHPVTMVVHAPSVKACIDRAIVRSITVNKTIEALFCSICACALTSMSDQQCEGIFSTDRELLIQQFQSMSLHRLMQAGFYTFPSHASLSAFSLLMLSLQGKIPSHTLVILSTVALRTAASLGMHREGSKLQAPPFETQLRRRIWWFLISIDSRAVELSGLSGQTLPPFDAQLPLNLNDADLQPGMKDTPPARSGATDMIYMLARYEMVNVHIKCSRVRQTGTPHVPGDAKFDAEIDRLEGTLEGRYLRFCDPLIPLHTLTTTMSRLGVTKLRMLWLGVTPRSQLTVEHDAARSMLRMIQYDNYLHANTQTRHFLWHVRNQYPWGAVLHLLEMAGRAYFIPASPSEDSRAAAHAATGDKIWDAASESLTNHPEIFVLDTDKPSPTPRPLQLGLIYTACRAWESRAEVTGERIDAAPKPLQDALHARAQGLPLTPERDRSASGSGSSGGGNNGAGNAGFTSGGGFVQPPNTTAVDPLFASMPPMGAEEFRSAGAAAQPGGGFPMAMGSVDAGRQQVHPNSAEQTDLTELNSLLQAPSGNFDMFGAGLLDTYGMGSVGASTGMHNNAVGQAGAVIQSPATRFDNVEAEWDAFGMEAGAFEFFADGQNGGRA